MNTKKILKISDKLYFSFSVLIVIIVVFLSANEVINTFVGNADYERAHQNANSFDRRIEKEKSIPNEYFLNIKPFTKEIMLCFNLDGNLVSANEKDPLCYGIEDFHKKNIFAELVCCPSTNDTLPPIV